MTQHDANFDADQADAGGGGEETEFYAEPSSPKNNQMMVLFGLMIVGAAALYFFYFKKAPAGALASAEAVAADETINAFLTEQGSSIEQMEAMRRNTEKVVQRFLNYPANTQVPLSDLRPNPFRMLEDAPPDPGAAEAIAKALREAQRQQVLKDVEGLNLQSIMFGTKPTCMINNALFPEGAQVDGFTIEKITPGNVVVRKDVFRFELKMQRPDKPAVRF